MSDLCIICLIAVVFAVSRGIFITREFITKPEFDNKISNNELLGEYSSGSLFECGLNCQGECTCRLFGYNPSLKKCRIHRRNITSGMSDETGWRYYSHHYLPVDCNDLRNNCRPNTGVYEIYPFGTSSRPIRVYCDMDTMDGGWTAIQKRIDGSLSFDRNWTDYKNGFGAAEQNFWIGNDVIHQITKGKVSSLYVSIKKHKDRLYELYDQFSVSNEAEKYKLFLAGPATGTLGDSMLNTALSRNNLSGMYFSTPDRDNDRSDKNCANSSSTRGGWWFNSCRIAFLNGPWYPASWSRPWYPTVISGIPVKETMMLIKHH